MKSINRVMEENNFIILATVEEAQILAKDIRERERHCTCIIELEDGQFTVWPEGYALRAGIEPVEVFHMHEIESSSEENVPEERIAGLLKKILGIPEEGDERSQGAHDLLKTAIGCLLIRHGTLEFTRAEIDNMDKLAQGFELMANQEGFTIAPRRPH